VWQEASTGTCVEIMAAAVAGCRPVPFMTAIVKRA
jgi:hypothetical protein